MIVELGDRYHIPPRKYTFQIVKTATSIGKYSDVMIQGCSALGPGFKPVCNASGYYDSKCIYLGLCFEVLLIDA